MYRLKISRNSLVFDVKRTCRSTVRIQLRYICFLCSGWHRGIQEGRVRGQRTRGTVLFIMTIKHKVNFL